MDGGRNEALKTPEKKTSNQEFEPPWKKPRIDADLDPVTILFRLMTGIFDPESVDQAEKLLAYHNISSEERTKLLNYVCTSRLRTTKGEERFARSQWIRMLVSSSDADVNAMDSKGKSPLHYACEQGIVEFVNVLLDARDVNVNIQDSRTGKTPLMYACTNIHPNVVTSLLSRKDTDVNVGNAGGMTALHMTCSLHNLDILRMLLAHESIDVNVRSFQSGLTPLHVACGEHGHHGAVAALLSNKGIDVNVRSGILNSPLHYAITESHYGNVKALVEHPDTDLSLCNQEGMSPMSMAISSRRLDIIALFSDAVDRGSKTLDFGWQGPYAFAPRVFYLDEEDVRVSLLDLAAVCGAGHQVRAFLSKNGCGRLCTTEFDDTVADQLFPIHDELVYPVPLGSSCSPQFRVLKNVLTRLWLWWIRGGGKQNPLLLSFEEKERQLATSTVDIKTRVRMHDFQTLQSVSMDELEGGPRQHFILRTAPETYAVLPLPFIMDILTNFHDWIYECLPPYNERMHSMTWPNFTSDTSDTSDMQAYVRIPVGETNYVVTVDHLYGAARALCENDSMGPFLIFDLLTGADNITGKKILTHTISFKLVKPYNIATVDLTSEPHCQDRSSKMVGDLRLMSITVPNREKFKYRTPFLVPKVHCKRCARRRTICRRDNTHTHSSFE